MGVGGGVVSPQEMMAITISEGKKKRKEETLLAVILLRADLGVGVSPSERPPEPNTFNP